ncbi:hypothetical protein V5N11_016156 [Cardamine amara subsp. amara]|uniref:Uncharacterized protein n=1 Tax=Cardamine amara subsp. amara TaxID=228776 RepID=A0ABD0ZID6_CARAN
MNPPNQPTGGSRTISGVEEGSSCCIIQMENPPKSLRSLKESAGSKSCCIFRIPHTLVEANETVYKPKIVSIGPYHHLDGKNHLQMIQEHKQRYLDIFLSKTKEKGVHLTDLRQVVLGLEEKIRSSYSEDLKFDRESLFDMMLLDGCFILTLFQVVLDKSWRENYPDDPIFLFRWILPILRSDLLLLENQVPLFLLQDLHRTSKLFPPTISLNTIIFRFFGYSIIRPKEFWKKMKDLDGRHLLDLIRQTFIPDKSHKNEEQSWTNIFYGSKFFNIISPCKKKVQAETSKLPLPPPTPKLTQSSTKLQPPPRPFLKLVHSARKLRLGGIKFKPKEKFETPLDITFKNGVLEIPLLQFDDFFSSLLINFVAFEQFNLKYCTTEMTSYVTFMGCLINSAEDATFLSEKGIIENYFGTGEQVSLFFKNTGKDIAFSISTSYLANVFEGVNNYVSKGWHVQWAGFKYTHFNSPWAFLSSCAALVLLLLTIFQAFFAAYAYFRPPK